MTPTELRAKRKSVGISLAALSARAPVSRWRLIEFELGNVQLNEEELARIEAALRRYSEERIRELTQVAQVAAAS